MNQKKIFITAGISGAIAVGAGAFGAHLLEPLLMESGRLDTYHTAVSYHFYHTLLLGMLGAGFNYLNTKTAKYSAVFTTAGILIFSGSLYILCLTGITWLGAVTPIGGLSLIAGWLLFAASAFSRK